MTTTMSAFAFAAATSRPMRAVSSQATPATRRGLPGADVEAGPLGHDVDVAEEGQPLAADLDDRGAMRVVFGRACAGVRDVGGVERREGLGEDIRAEIEGSGCWRA